MTAKPHKTRFVCLHGHSRPETLLARVRGLLLGVRSLNLPFNRWSVQDALLDACLLAGPRAPKAREGYEELAGALELPVEVLPFAAGG